MGKRERQNNNVTFYKVRHALSSSGLSQSFLSEASLTEARLVLLPEIFVSRKTTKSKTSPSIVSGIFWISRRTRSLVVIKISSSEVYHRTASVYFFFFAFFAGLDFFAFLAGT